MTERTRLFTIGHSNRSLNEFMNLLEKHRVGLIVDLRSSPSSRFQQFNRSSLAPSLVAHGIRYEYLGDLLGGKPQSEESDWQQGKLSHNVIATLRASKRWSMGLQRLKEQIEAQSQKGIALCLLCSERRADQCHRNAVASDLLRIIGVEIVHIDSIGSEAGVQDRLL